MTEWRVYDANTPQCTSSGMRIAFTKYQCGQGMDVKEITGYCPNYGTKNGWCR